MSCPNPFDTLRMRTEFLGPQLYNRAVWLDPWLNLIKRSEWPVGAGLVQSSFEVGRSEPSTEEETWPAITTTSGSTFIGSCSASYTDVVTGYIERQYSPESFDLRGPLICQTDLTIHWNSVDFWEKYMIRLEQRNTRSIVNRHLNVYGSVVPKVVANSDGSVTKTDGVASAPASGALDLTGVSIPACGLDQSHLDTQVQELIMAGASAEDSGGWVTNLGSGPVWPLLIGIDASNQILLNNPDLREDFRQAYQGFGDAAPVIQRLGASRVIKNFRHMITATPPRWGINDSGALYRISPWRMINGNVTSGYGKGQISITNPDYINPGIAAVEGAIVLSPWVVEEQVLRPVNAAPGMRWTAQDYYGDWRFVSGIEALLGMDGCTNPSDPLHEFGRHFGKYKHGYKVIYPDYGRLFLFKRCPQVAECQACS